MNWGFIFRYPQGIDNDTFYNFLSDLTLLINPDVDNVNVSEYEKIIHILEISGYNTDQLMLEVRICFYINT